ncbi:heavy-metal-associated domain-containing protein [Streptomyces sp. NBC_01803]|uniref:heavy-metal-associated domain-containing protein n=1 Tax=Streptomyces sp. NBC_01803 TaxID=2975946 RepID=UPI002DDC3D8E|nr:cation transporter [Streptomyces sp. NBC_01803]WSA44957.1 cation transporter [Streptomyces sp. NBC_01803]
MSTSAPAPATVATYAVTGMTCSHCVGSVTTELGKITGVGGVDVDLQAGTVTVTSAAPLDDAAVAAAVEEAGYEVVPAPDAEASSCCGGGGCH